MTFKSLGIAAAVAATLVSGHAAQAEGLDYRISGFGTVGYATTNSDTAAFRTIARQDTGASENDASWEVDTRLGLQGNVKFNDTFSAVGQVVAARRDGEFAPTIEWLYGQAKVTDWADVRVGRMVLPVFMVSDSRNVGYASHWLRAPREAYGMYPASSFDGVQAVLRQNLADTNFTLQLSAGNSKADIYTTSGTTLVSGMVDYSQTRSLNLVAEQGNWTGRLGYTVANDTDVTIVPGLVGAKDKFTGAGVQYDDGQLLVAGEYVMRRFSHTTYNKAFDSNSYYLTAGYRLGSIMPYATVSAFEPKGFFYAANMTTSRSLAVGARWDALPNIALKAQVEQSKNSSQNLVLSPAYDPKKSLRVYSVALDFVF